MSVWLDRAGVVAVTGGRSERARTVVYQQSASGDYRSVPGVATDGLPLRAWAHLDPEELPGIDATRASATRGTKKGTVEGADFAKALTSVFIGASPPTTVLKQGMLGL